MLKLISKNVWVMALMAAFFMASCDQAADVVTEETTEEFVDQALFVLQEQGNIGRNGCYELIFPITVEFPDGTTVTANDYEELGTAIKTWKEANPDATERPSFVFPIEVLSEDGEVISVASHEELRALKEACPGNYFGHHGPRGHRGKCNPCFEIVFPIDILFPDGTTAEAADRMTLKTLIREWKEANPDEEERPEIVFPIEVEMEEDGTIVTVNDLDELKALKESCGDD